MSPINWEEEITPEETPPQATNINWEAEDTAAAATPESDPGIVERGAFLPIGRTGEGELELAVPQFLIDISKSAALPGRALKGEAITPEEITRSALDIGVPALRGIGGTAMRQVTKPATRAQVKAAPTTAQLKKQGTALFKSAREGGAVIKADSYQNMLAAMETNLAGEGFDTGLHPKVAAAFNAMGKRLGDEMDLQDIQLARRHARNAAGSLDPDEARLGSHMVDQIDSYVKKLKKRDLVSGKIKRPVQHLTKARSLWSKMRKSEMIDDIFKSAATQASGIENGLRIGFRALLKDKRRIRGFSSSERDAMREVVAGTATRNILKRIGKLGPGTGRQTNVLGAMGGAGGGALVGGPAGMVAVPAVGWIAQKAAEKGTKVAAEKARAMAAGVRPEITDVPYGPQDIKRFILGQAIAAEVGDATAENAAWIKRGGI